MGNFKGEKMLIRDFEIAEKTINYKYSLCNTTKGIGYCVWFIETLITGFRAIIKFCSF